MFRISIITIVIVVTSISCSTNPQPLEKFKLIEKRTVPARELSGLTLAADSILFSVSDHTGKVYKLNTHGELIDSFKISDNDFEGITTLPDNRIALVEEKLMQIITITHSGIITNVINSNLSSEINNGFEGITYLPSDSTLLIANEKNPVAIYKFTLTGELISSREFVNSADISGLFYQESKNILWILSEESNKIMKCNLDLEVLDEFVIPDDKIEGIAVSGNNIYLISDDSHRFYHYEILN